METIYRDTIDPETIARHQSCADRFLKHAQTNIAEGNIERAIQAIARCLSHSATALAENRPLWHRSPRQMENVLRWYVRDGDFSRSHVKTFREIYNSPHLPKSKHHTTHNTHTHTNRRQNVTHSDGQTRRRQNTTHIDATQPTSHANTNRRQNVTHINDTQANTHHQRNAFTSLTRLRRRAAAFLKAANAIIAGQPLPVRPTQRYLRKPHEITPPTFYSVRDITNLPNFAKIRSHFRLPNELAAKTDPHGHYEFLRQEPVPCYCHPKPRKITTNSAFITLSPLWRRALEKTFHIKLPTPLPLRI